ncbi:glycosyltransferase family 2 protein [Lentibacter algarum]|uniref:glycosyltransferase family 2 protein n=1 Tax=Lentibacter algarum TaxID=576131 RepID=UPI002090CE2B|nr:glycosyltransferase family 2 protein [Lentibacter algarum]
MLYAQAQSSQLDCRLSDVLLAEGILTEAQLTEAFARYLELPLVDIVQDPPELDLGQNYDPALMLRHRVIPWRIVNGRTVLLASNSDDFAAFVTSLHLPPVQFELALALPTQIETHIIQNHRQYLTERASSRVPEDESCRTWEKHTSMRRLGITIVGLAGLLTMIVLFPKEVFAIFALWATATLVVSAVMRLLAFAAEKSTVPDQLPPECPPDALPRISVLVPLFKEREIASVLLKRLSRLTYPKAKLEVVLAVEETDSMTRDALRKSELPNWMKIVVVPEGSPKTKPRAMNYALDFCAGDIIGIWDAEDAPAPDQLETVARHFASAPENLVCLQGILDYYNSRQNWLARCFTIEYAAWFRLILPGMSRLGLAIPLGGTTLFFKRRALEELGGWDAHNVTEDADLGFRLARHGYRTDVISTRTGEEANCRIWPWIRQRSRWLKGYLVTYFVHMRHPLLLWKQLGTWKFLGFQAHFVSALSQFILAPVLWSFWLVIFGLPHPLEQFVSHDILLFLGLSFLAIEVLNALINATAVARPDLKHLLMWVPTMHFYYPLGAIAAYKALYELVLKPFYWDKTQHGISLKQAVEISDTAPTKLDRRVPGVEL